MSDLPFQIMAWSLAILTVCASIYAIMWMIGRILAAKEWADRKHGRKS